MTKRERIQAAELLRCTADRLLGGAQMMNPLTETANDLYGDCHAEARVLTIARDLMHDVMPFWWGDHLRTEAALAALEAAARLEDRSPDGE